MVRVLAFLKELQDEWRPRGRVEEAAAQDGFATASERNLHRFLELLPGLPPDAGGAGGRDTGAPGGGGVAGILEVKLQVSPEGAVHVAASRGGKTPNKDDAKDSKAAPAHDASDVLCAENRT